MKVRTREATADEATALAAVHALSFDKPWAGWELRRVLSVTGTYAFAVDGADEVEGFAVGRSLVGEAELLTLAVRPSRRRRGVGRSLTQAVAARALATGAERLLLEVGADNPAAVRLYRELGFEEVGLRRSYYARPGGVRADALVLALSLNSGGPGAYAAGVPPKGRS